MSGNKAAPDANVAPSTHACGVSWPIAWLLAMAVTPAQQASPLMA
ncbi:hypothetical protein GCM10012275_32940 [Longimycelium tulufanense]|uniref:Uncharacterized protein n=1 Tax=Longimycelium tulufanense TaxID=907463 RepID=A0A8J3CGV8_9PSEU|nr:hypothetical protein GCM10012275_32940 [Longimycelium tulufanense]